VISLAEGDPAGALTAVQRVLDGTAPVIGYATLVESHLLAARAHAELGHQSQANQAAERALTLAEADRLVLPFAMTGSAELLETLPRHETAHAALLTDILDIIGGSCITSAEDSVPPTQELSPSERRVLRYLPTNLSRPEIANELSVSLHTLNTHLHRMYAKLGVDDRSAAVQRARELRLLSMAARSGPRLASQFSDARPFISVSCGPPRPTRPSCPPFPCRVQAAIPAPVQARARPSPCL